MWPNFAASLGLGAIAASAYAAPTRAPNGIPEALPRTVLGVYAGALVWVQPLRWTLPVGSGAQILDACSIRIAGKDAEGATWSAAWDLRPSATVIDGAGKLAWPVGEAARIGHGWEERLRKVTGPSVGCDAAVAALRAAVPFRKAGAERMRELTGVSE